MDIRDLLCKETEPPAILDINWASRNRLGEQADVHEWEGVSERVFTAGEALQRRKRSYLCTKCNQLYGTKSSLTRHQRVVHNHERPYACPVCSKRFSSKSCVKRHARIHVASNMRFALPAVQMHEVEPGKLA
uniref:C2H2-type domain-containing protein n=1 Tax=Rhodosorus marinus TaxID=101924 RepID=A0A7S0BCX5_9RHOD|mmetsp:Transcript_10959/g.15801  ORF Transcript_10959/g.15801 Transcript_10959/m.15801 type:complete len:132 (+) Transcript_10959:230-625(+)